MWILNWSGYVFLHFFVGQLLYLSRRNGDNLRVWRLWRFKSIFSCDEWTTSPTRTGSPHEPMVRFLSIFSVWCFHCTFFAVFQYGLLLTQSTLIFLGDLFLDFYLCFVEVDFRLARTHSHTKVMISVFSRDVSRPVKVYCLIFQL